LNHAIDAKSAKWHKIRSTGYEKQHIMVMLCLIVMAIPPYFILSHKAERKSEDTVFSKTSLCMSQINLLLDTVVKVKKQELKSIISWVVPPCSFEASCFGGM
jgi:hypothetical protein